MIKNYLVRFHEWMVREGRMDEEGLPSEPLSPRTAKNRMNKVRRILIDVGYIKRIPKDGHRYIYNFQRGSGKGNIRKLTIKEITDWFNKELTDAKARRRKADYVEAMYKFADFIHFEFRHWSKAKVKALRRSIRRPWVPPSWENKVSILPIEKIDGFIEYLKSQSRMHHMMAYLMRYANMRHIEVINARSELVDGTLIEDFKHNLVIIYGKGRGGLSQRRTTPFFPDNQNELNDFLCWRNGRGIKSEWLFVNQYGSKFTEHSGHFNQWLRNKGHEYGFTSKENKLLTSHKIGRHAYGTDMTIKGLPERLLADNMGIRNPMILTRYQNATDEIRVRETLRCLGNDVNPVSVKEPKTTDANLEKKQELLNMLMKGKIDEETFKMGVAIMQS